MANNRLKEDLISEWKLLRGKFYNLYEEDLVRFEKLCKHHELYESVVQHFDKDFKHINQVAQEAIDEYLRSKS